jgi:hypothetical protein
LEDEIVERAGGGLTTTCSPHLESVVVTFVPPESVSVLDIGRFVPLAERVRVLASFGIELVAAVVHRRT